MGLRDEIQTDIAKVFNEDLAHVVHTFTCARVTALGSFRVVHIQQDPTAAIWECQLRKV